MSNQTLSTLIAIVQDLVYTVVFLLCAAASYLTLRQPKVKQWLAGSGALVRAVLFIALATLLSQALTPIITDLFAFPWGLIHRDSGFTASAKCLGGVLVLVGLVVGSWLLAKRSRGPGENG